jgi:hypothetical protein
VSREKGWWWWERERSAGWSRPPSALASQPRPVASTTGAVDKEDASSKQVPGRALRGGAGGVDASSTGTVENQSRRRRPVVDSMDRVRLSF